MPVLKISTNSDIKPGLKAALLKTISTQVASMLGKPERYVMVMLENNPDMIFDGTPSPLAYLELKSIDLPEHRTAEFSSALCGMINQHLDIPNERIYIEFSNAERHLWGWNAATF
jgi:phenylpyruvate tautomerase